LKHWNLKVDAKTLVILVQIGSVELWKWENIFQGCLEGLNVEH